MPISFPFLLFAKPLGDALRWIRTDIYPPPLPVRPPDEIDRVWLERQLIRRLPSDFVRDVLRDE